ncbi:hypothetical protein [Actinomadura rayongensis]|uniref:Uncharacterized protein n=1 Tax=Actinomadura rayongensis TaxID=1429076 RepID=A0A6I4W602_9ACTN|nr:hypothetical protein [Actinomadura rayongensis]MXQ62574.1 hypothetical protein [Actinomadura rayongensis]
MSNPPPPPGWEPPGGSSWPPPPPPAGGPQNPGAPGGPPPGQGFGGGPPPGPGFGGPGTPPPFYGPGGPPPPGPPAKRGMGGGAIAAIVVGALVVIVALAVVVVVIVAAGGKSPKEQLTAAADKVAAARALTYKGSITSGSDTLQGELTVTKGGRATGPITWDGSQVTLLAADDKTFVKADSSYWKDKITSTSDPSWFLSGQQWGRLGSSDLTLNFKTSLTPTVIADKLREAARLNRKPVKTTNGGRKALKFTTGSATLYLTDSDDPELIRYESLFPRVQADVQVADNSVISDLRQEMSQLGDSFDVSSRPSIAQWKKGNCNSTSGCLVEAQVRPPAGLDGPTEIQLRFNITAFTLTGRDLGNCTAKVTVSGDSPVWTRCEVVSSAWTDWAKKGGTFYKHVEYKVAGVSSSDIQTMQTNLDQE